ncbi:hypothetical protein T07_8392 [Trichinella nelsoni]|uniref:Uncharacterized protein n=1 Tax=Trichinella nelsoni TaxID=6336 RepID=A0A0V0RMR7_9BILA|nr:hypothetical protein T07_7971 [Trichinella nelsoni]KRX16117.1 hypothetical protein T07_8392 [Trichinella nelsoni]
MLAVLVVIGEVEIPTSGKVDHCTSWLPGSGLHFWIIIPTMAAVRVVSSTGRLVSAFLCSYPVQLIVFGSIIASQSGAGWVEACNLIG